MSRISRAAGHWAARLLPTGRRDWAEALWAEADQVPPGLGRLAWRAGGVRLIAREVLTARRVGAVVLFAVAGGAMVRGAWPGPAGNFATLVDRVDVVTTVLLLSAVPLAARRFFGPAHPGRLTRILRASGYVAVLALVPAKAVVEQFAYTVPRGGDQLRLYRNVPGLGLPGTVWLAGIRPPGSTWLCESLFLFITAGYVAAIFWLTSQRSRVAPATLAIGLGAGMVLGAVMYALAPLGLSKSATNPWLPGSEVDPLVWLAWIALLGRPVAAGVLAARRYHRPD